jgi:hypothetical protein
MGAQGVSNDALVSAHRPLRPGPRIVAGSSLPAHPALLGNNLDMAVALRWIGFDRWTEHGRRARWHDNRSFRRVLGYSIVNSILIVGAVGNDRGERLVDLGKQGAEFGGIVDFLAGQGRGDDRAGLRIDSKVQLAPGAAAPGAMLLDQPFR